MLLRKISPIVLILIGIVLFLLAYSEHISMQLNVLLAATYIISGITYFLSAYIISNKDIGISLRQAKNAIAYSCILTILFFGVPLTNYAITGKISSEILGAYKLIVMTGPFLVSLMLAINLKNSGLEVQSKLSKYIFILIGFVVLITIGVAILSFLFVLSSIA